MWGFILWAMTNIGENNKLLHRVKISIGSSQSNWLPGVLLTPSYQNRTLPRNTIICINPKKLV
jgi:hypothetical protein